VRRSVVNPEQQQRAALLRPEDRADAIRVAHVVRQLHTDAIAEFGELEAEDLVGHTLQYVRDRIVDVYGQSAWEEVADLRDGKV